MHSSPELRLKGWKAQGQYFSYQNHQIFYQDQGEGEVLVCIHGFPTASWDWVKIWTELTNHFRVIAPDMLGFGFSDKPRRYDYAIHDQASLHEELLKHLNISKAHILAHDYGDTVAQEMLARHEERLQSGKSGLKMLSLCFLNGGIFPEMHRARPIQKLLEGPLGFLISRFFSEKRFQKSFSEVFGAQTQPTPQELKDFWELITYQGGHRLSHKLIHYMADRRQYRDRWVKPLLHTQVPLRLINGPEDPVSGRHAAERWQELVPNPDVVLLEGIGHYPQVEDPQGVWEAYWTFVEPHLKKSQD